VGRKAGTEEENKSLKFTGIGQKPVDRINKSDKNQTTSRKANGHALNGEKKGSRKLKTAEHHV